MCSLETQRAALEAVVASGLPEPARAAARRALARRRTAHPKRAARSRARGVATRKHPSQALVSVDEVLAFCIAARHVHTRSVRGGTWRVDVSGPIHDARAVRAAGAWGLDDLVAPPVTQRVDVDVAPCGLESVIPHRAARLCGAVLRGRRAGALLMTPMHYAFVYDNGGSVQIATTSEACRMAEHVQEVLGEASVVARVWVPDCATY